MFDLKEIVKKIDIDLNDEQIKKFEKYMDLLLEWNEKINLTAITEKDGIILKHFVDSMTVLKYIDEGSSIIDVGTGAGFPGIPISIVSDKYNVTLMDALNKRINFLNEVISNLELKNIQALHGRAEEMGQNQKFREKYDYTVSRAVANLSVLVEYLLPLTKVGGRCICMKGSDIDEELKQSKFAINLLGGKIEKIDKFTLPNSDIKRNIIVIKKEKGTPKKFPRRAGIPSKQPIKK